MSWTHLSDSTPTARKPHKCIWCGETIVKGEKHNLQTGIFDGDFQSTRYHMECFKAARTFDYWELEDGFQPYSFDRGSVEERGTAARLAEVEGKP